MASKGAERNLRGVTLAELDVIEIAFPRSECRCPDRGPRCIRADDTPPLPTSSRVRNATSPAPLRTSSTRMPSVMPASRRNCRVIGSRKRAWARSRSISWSSWPRTYGAFDSSSAFVIARPGYPLAAQRPGGSAVPRSAARCKREFGCVL